MLNTKENEYSVSGYSFTNYQMYKEAKREAETIDYIRANTDLRDHNKLLKLYHKLIERKTLKTLIGYEFLKELQDRILESGIISKDNLPTIPVELDHKQLKVYSNELEHANELKKKEQREEFRIRLRNSRIINIFLIVVIVIMFLLAILSNNNVFLDNEVQVLDRYAAWEEELEAREKQLDEREAALKDE